MRGQIEIILSHAVSSNSYALDTCAQAKTPELSYIKDENCNMNYCINDRSEVLYHLLLMS